MKLLLDQGTPRSAVEWLQSYGFDAVHVGDLGMARAEDPEIVARAAVESRVIVTLDADFHDLLAASNAREPSVIRLRIEGLGGQALADLLTPVLQE